MPQSATLLNENIGTEQVASQTTDENDAEVREKIANLQQKISDVKSECSGIKKDLDTIFGFTTATTVASGLGTVSAGGALTSGLIKSGKDKKVEENVDYLAIYRFKTDYQELRGTFNDVLIYLRCDGDHKDPRYDGRAFSIAIRIQEEYTKVISLTDEVINFMNSIKIENNRIKGVKEELQEIRNQFYLIRDKLSRHSSNYDVFCSAFSEAQRSYSRLIDKATLLIDEFIENCKNEKNKSKEFNENELSSSKTLGNVRTGLMAGATVTSAVSTGTSIGATVNAEKLAKKMSDCNEAVRQLKLAISIAEAEEVEEEKLANAREITSACTGFDKDNINTLKTQMTASAIVSGIGTATAGAGTITSAMANSKKVREDDSEKGRKKEKGLNLASNILAGVTMGTSATSTVLSATAISKAKKDSKMAEECEAVLK